MKCLKKLLLLFLLLVTFMFFIIPLNKAFANVIYNYNGNDIEFADLPLKFEVETQYAIFDGGRYGYSLVYYEGLDFGKFVMDNGVLKSYKKDGTHIVDGSVKLCDYDSSSKKWKDFKDWGDCTGGIVGFIYSNVDVFNTDGTVFFAKTLTKKSPYIVNSLDSLATWKFDNLWVDYGDYDINKTIYLHICKKTVDVSGASSFYYTDSVIALSANGKYYESYEDGQVYYFSIPKDNLPFTVSSGDKIIFYLSANVNNLGGAYSSDEPLKDSNIFDTKSFTVGSSYTDEDKQKDYQDKISSSLEDQKQAIEENTKTNKNIFEKIGDILSYINPFSDNFFGKKLVELILDGLKGLFVPEDGFFDTYFSDLKNWFSDRLGFLWTPFDIIIDILNKILNINFSDPIFHIPEINEPFTGSKLISEYDYNLNDLLDNEVFKNIHNIYFIGVDAVIIFALINLARRKIEEVFSN